MKPYLIVRSLCLLVSVVFLALAYILAGYPRVLLAFLAMILFAVVGRKWSPFWVASSMLAVYFVLAAVATTLSAPLLLVVTGCISALAAWDLSDFRPGTGPETSGNPAETLERRRLQSLGLMAAISLLAGVIGTGLHLELPFGMIALLGLIAAGGVLYVAYRLTHARTEAGQPR